MTVPGPLPPAGVRRIIDFVNTRPLIGRPDQLDGPATPGPVRELRDALAAVLGSDPGDPAHAAGWRVVNDLAARSPLAVSFLPGPNAVLAPVADQADPIVGRLVADVHAAVAADQWTRLHLCANDACGVAFYDSSRSRTQRWHSYEVCGNRVNVAAHRRRQGL
jgi:hypothetical protein